MRTFIGVLWGLLLAAFIASGCSKPAEPPKPAAPAAPAPAAGTADGKALFEQKCSACHATDRATSRKETREKWAEIVNAMRGKKSGWISDDEAARIVDFLASQPGK